MIFLVLYLSWVQESNIKHRGQDKESEALRSRQGEELMTLESEAATVEARLVTERTGNGKWSPALRCVLSMHRPCVQSVPKIVRTKENK